MSAIKGIDVSVHQGAINWDAVAKSDVKFAMLRAGYGSYEKQKDKQFEANYKGAKNAGIPIGVYHYSYATNTKEAEKEANVLLKWLKGKSFEYPVAYDIEDKVQAQLGKTMITAIAKTFCDILEKAGYYVVIYSSKSWFTSFFDDSIFKKYDIWVAQWNNNCTINRTYGMWQFTNEGKVNGIKTRVDMNYAYKNYPYIMKSYGLNGYKKTTQPIIVEKPTENKPTVIKAGAKITLKNEPLYYTSVSRKGVRNITGTYYYWDAKIIRGKIRITNSLKNVGKMGQVTGWIKAPVK